MEETVGAFRAAREDALGLARERKESMERRERERENDQDGLSRRPGKRRRVERDPGPTARDDAGSQRQTRSRSKRDTAVEQKTDAIEIGDSDEDLQDEGEGERQQQRQQQQPDDGLVPCPMCGKRMKEDSVFLHLDRCEDEQKTDKRTRAPNFPIQRPPSRPNDAKPLERLPELNYSLLKDNAMRKKLSELGIPTWGNKQLMVRRHTEWVNIWNANCDSSRPRTKRELLQELDRWEHSQGGHSREGTATTNGVMKKDFDSQAYQASHTDDFARLIAEARRKRNSATPKADGTNDENANTNTNGAPEPVHSTQQPTQSSNGRDTAEHPYENNPQAMTSIREKVAAANAGEHIEPLMNKDFRHPDEVADTTISHQLDPTPEDQAAMKSPRRPEQTHNAALLDQVHFGNQNPGVGRVNGERRESDLGHRITETLPSRKVPMFQVPQDPVADVDQGAIGH